MNSLLRQVAVCAGGLMLAAVAIAQTADRTAGLIGKRHAGPDFAYDHFNGAALDQAMGAALTANLPLSRAFDLEASYRYTDASGDAFDSKSRTFSASLLTHRDTEYGVAYFAAGLGHGWNRVDAAGAIARENGVFWSVRAGYEIPVAPRTAINAGLSYVDAFDSAIAQPQALHYFAEANHWFSPDLAGVLGFAYRQIKQAPDAMRYTAGLRWAF